MPQVRGTEHCDIGGDRRIAREPVLHERKDSERERKREVFIALTADLALLDESRKPFKIVLVEIPAERNDVYSLALPCRQYLDMIVEHAVCHDPVASAEIADDPLGDAVGELAAARIESEKVEQRREQVDDRQRATGDIGEETSLGRDGGGVLRLVDADG